MAVERPINDYTNRDYASLLTSLLDLAAQKFPEWTDRSENDLGRLLLESFAYVGDVLLYYQDRIANEAFLSTAVERRSAIDLLELIGYTLATPAPASAELTVRVANDSNKPVLIQPRAVFATKAASGQPAVEFRYLPVDEKPLEIPRDGTGGVRERKLIVINAVQIQNEVLGISNGEPNQSFRPIQRLVLLPRDPNSQDYLQVIVDTGSSQQKWERVGTLLNSYSSSTHYIVRIHETDEAEIIFGDGQYGQIPPPNSTIRATYLIGGGARGNVGPGTIQVVQSGVNTNIKVVNLKAASGGAERESIDHARRQAPGVFRSLGRAVTAADYMALAENFPGVVKATAVAPSWNYVDIYVVAAGNLEPSGDLRARLIQYFEDKRMVTTLVNVRAPVFVKINITIRELGIEPSFYQDDVKQRAEDALRSLFHIERLSFGQSIYLSKFYEAIENVVGVAFVRGTGIAGTRSQPEGEEEVPQPEEGLLKLQSKEFPRLGEIDITDVNGGLEDTRSWLS